MPPQPPESTAPGRRPRHAAVADPGAPSMDGRHRRPETLADATRLRPETLRPDATRRASATRPAAPGRRRGAAPGRPGGARGRHAAPPDIAVRPLPVVRDVVVNARDW